MMDDQSDANRIKSLIEWPNVIRNTSYRVMRLVFKFLYRHVNFWGRISCSDKLRFMRPIDAGSSADEKDLAARQFQVVLQGFGQHLHGGDQHVEDCIE